MYSKYENSDRASALSQDVLCTHSVVYINAYFRGDNSIFFL